MSGNAFLEKTCVQRLVSSRLHPWKERSPESALCLACTVSSYRRFEPLGTMIATPCINSCMQRAKDIVKISLGAAAVNELLGGGLESRCITEIYGEFR